jgi:hypothetical protein
MKHATAVALVFAGGFIIMVLEIVGARFLPIYFGSSFHIWVSQIGVILIALAAGYYGGGALADRWPRLRVLGFLLVPASLLILTLPDYAAPVLDAVINRHPEDQPIPAFWLKCDPVLGSALIFLLPCALLAAMSPFMIRVSAPSLARVGHASGLIIASSTIGSIVGVFVSGFVLIDQYPMSTIFRLTGGGALLLSLACMVLDRWFAVGATVGQTSK